MKKISLDGFINIINVAIQSKEEKTRFRITEYDYSNTFSIDVDNKEVVYLEVPEEKKCDVIWEKLQKAFEGRFETVWSHQFWGNYDGIMVIDNKVAVFFSYKKPDGQIWLSTQYGSH